MEIHQSLVRKMLRWGLVFDHYVKGRDRQYYADLNPGGFYFWLKDARRIAEILKPGGYSSAFLDLVAHNKDLKSRKYPYIMLDRPYRVSDKNVTTLAVLLDQYDRRVALVRWVQKSVRVVLSTLHVRRHIFPNDDLYEQLLGQLQDEGVVFDSHPDGEPDAAYADMNVGPFWFRLRDLITIIDRLKPSGVTPAILELGALTEELGKGPYWFHRTYHFRGASEGTFKLLKEFYNEQKRELYLEVIGFFAALILFALGLLGVVSLAQNLLSKFW